jgi:cell division septum initiation protein DivIVA
MSDALLTRIAEALEGLLAHAKADIKAEVQEIEAKVKGKGKSKATEPAASAPVAQAAAAAAPAVADPAPAPAAPAVSITDINKLVLKVAAKSRDRALEILGSFKLSSTVGLAPEMFQAVYDAFEEEVAKIDAAAAKVSEASLV